MVQPDDDAVPTDLAAALQEGLAMLGGRLGENQRVHHAASRMPAGIGVRRFIVDRHVDLRVFMFRPRTLVVIFHRIGELLGVGLKGLEKLRGLGQMRDVNQGLMMLVNASGVSSTSDSQRATSAGVRFC